MTAIEEIYKAYGVDKQRVIDCCTTEEYFECEDKHNCVNCDKCIHFEYPPFTAEKQLKLLQILTECRWFCWSKRVDGKEGMSIVLDCARCSYEGDYINLAEAIADLTLALKDELDHAKVKEILEG